MPASSLLVIRHGQSTWNADGRWQGQADPPLSTLGVRQAKSAAAVLGSFDLIAASDLRRARTTAEVIAAELGIGPVQARTGLRERHAGEFQGFTKDEIEQRWPGYLAEQRTPDGWEHDDLVLARAAGALGEIASLVGGGTALVVTHGGVLRVLTEAGGGDPHVAIPNLAGRWFHVGSGEFRAGDAVTPVGDDLATRPAQIWQV